MPRAPSAGAALGFVTPPLPDILSMIYDPSCTRCPLHADAKTVCMPGVGDPRNTRAMIVGEAPGRNEDEQGTPFVGRAGHLLDSVLRDAFLTERARAEVFVTNVVKCRPPANRTPKTVEMRACEPYLAAEIESLDPMFILALGRAALWVLLRETTVSAWRGDWWELDRARETLVLVTYHPAFVLRQGLGSEAHSQFHDDVCMFANKVIANAGKDPRASR